MKQYDKPDKNTKAIVKTLEAYGASVERIRSGGWKKSNGTPDLLVGYATQTYLMEVKADNGALSEAQKEWHRRWRGGTIYIVRTPEQAIKVIRPFD